MMAFASLEDVIPKIIKNINFQEYLLDNQYKLLPNKNVKGFKCFIKSSSLILEDDIVFVGNHNGADIYYSSLFNDSGNILNFVKNRIELEVDYETFAPTKDYFIEAVRKLVIYINETGENEIKQDLKTTLEDIKNVKQNTFTSYYNCEPIFDLKYLESFNINQKIIEHPIFKDTIFNSRGLIYNEEQLDIINTAFPLFNESGKECGLYFENNIEKNKKVQTNIDFFAPGTVKTGLWFSNKFLQNKSASSKGYLKPKVTIVNNPKDALAHFSHLRENRFYIAVFTQDETSIEHIKSILNKERANLYLAGNCTIYNFVQEVKLLIKMLDAKIDFIKENSDNILVKFDNSEQQHFDKLFKLIKKHNAAKYEKTLETLGNDAKPFLQNDLIFPGQDKDENILIRIPKDFKTLYFFEQILIKVFPAAFNIFIEKPMYLDWTQQNIKIRTAVEDTTSEEEVIEKYIDEGKIFVLSN